MKYFEPIHQEHLNNMLFYYANNRRFLVILGLIDFAICFEDYEKDIIRQDFPVLFQQKKNLVESIKSNFNYNNKIMSVDYLENYVAYAASQYLLDEYIATIWQYNKHW